MGWLGWLLGGVRAVSNFFDSLYNRLPSSVRGLIFGFSVVVTVVLFIFFFRVRARINCYLDLGDSTRAREKEEGLVFYNPLYLKGFSIVSNITTSSDLYL